MHHEERMSLEAIGDVLGCHRQTVYYWMKKLNISRRSHSEAVARGVRKRPSTYRTTERGYEVWRSSSGRSNKKVKVHRLLAVSEFGMEAVEGKVVHHQNGIPWDNRPENIELLTAEEHIRVHKPSVGWDDV